MVTEVKKVPNNEMADDQIKYSKTYGNFTLKDWQIFARFNKLSTEEIKNCKSKNDLIKLVLPMHPNYLKEKVFFESFIDPNETQSFRAQIENENPELFP